MEKEYWAECVTCDTETQVLVIDEEEKPNYCPMCGYSIEYEELDEDEEDDA
mgnify:FL=1|tara:strand:+ start:165 stop:317 length:153 start_codon:yes stop_codon:yes gene_type:complete